MMHIECAPNKVTDLVHGNQAETSVVAMGWHSMAESNMSFLLSKSPIGGLDKNVSGGININAGGRKVDKKSEAENEPRQAHNETAVVVMFSSWEPAN